ncbi:MAG TPA: FAD-dependent oxidoreductase [Spirochaetia bacterium]|nr:FAD-dependent oxidoreductase [Spirochaetia bacterium]
MQEILRKADLAVVGGGPAGLAAAVTAAEAGVKTVLVDRSERLGGQLIKQTHRFFGSGDHYSGERGFSIAARLSQSVLDNGLTEVLTGSTAFGFYDDGIIGVVKDRTTFYIQPAVTILACGAAEKTLLFPNNDLPGIYGAGAVQTMVNVYGVLPGRRVLMVGTGNIGVIVSYQLLQAGMEVVACIDAAPTIGAYWVHAAKIARLGVPILTSCTVKEAVGRERLESAVTWQLDAGGRPVAGTEKEYAVDVMCLAVGLSPLTELVRQAGCQLAWIPELGGHLPLRDENMETTISNIFVAGDSAGVEEATTAMLEGSLAALSACARLGSPHPDHAQRRTAVLAQLRALRSGPGAGRIRAGLARLIGNCEGGHQYAGR